MTKHKMIATGYVVNEADLKVIASVYEEVANSASDESASAEPVYHVVLKYRNTNAAEVPAAPMTYDDIAAEAGEMSVPSLKNPEEKIVISAPVMIKYAKTKAFEHLNAAGEVKVNVHADIRYEY